MEAVAANVIGSIAAELRDRVDKFLYRKGIGFS